MMINLAERTVKPIFIQGNEGVGDRSALPSIDTGDNQNGAITHACSSHCMETILAFLLTAIL